jgi:4-hydroxy-3-polyprenylbenzoate decarboxylase
VPADADFVLEGYVDPSEPLFDEGPFGDHTGYYTPVDRFPRFHVTALTRRRDAIYPCTIVGPPPMEDAWLGKATERLFLPLLRMLFPDVVDMNLPVEGAFHNLVLVSIKQQYPCTPRGWRTGLVRTDVLLEGRLRVDDDVNVRTTEVAWRSPRARPAEGRLFVRGPIDQLDHGQPDALRREDDRRDTDGPREGWRGGPRCSDEPRVEATSRPCGRARPVGRAAASNGAREQFGAGRRRLRDAS